MPNWSCGYGDLVQKSDASEKWRFSSGLGHTLSEPALTVQPQPAQLAKSSGNRHNSLSWQLTARMTWQNAGKQASRRAEPMAANRAKSLSRSSLSRALALADSPIFRMRTFVHIFLAGTRIPPKAWNATVVIMQRTSSVVSCDEPPWEWELGPVSN